MEARTMQYDGDGDRRYYQESDQADGDPGSDSPQPPVPPGSGVSLGSEDAVSGAHEITSIKMPGRC